MLSTTVPNSTLTGLPAAPFFVTTFEIIIIPFVKLIICILNIHPTPCQHILSILNEFDSTHLQVCECKDTTFYPFLQEPKPTPAPSHNVRIFQSTSQKNSRIEKIIFQHKRRISQNENNLLEIFLKKHKDVRAPPNVPRKLQKQALERPHDGRRNIERIGAGVRRNRCRNE
jgi:hypothetical protein